MDMTGLYSSVRGAWLQAARGMVTGSPLGEVSGVKVCPGVRNGVLGMHCVILANPRNLWLDILMSGDYTYQLPAVDAIRTLAEAAKPHMSRSARSSLGFMPNELLAITQTDPTARAAAGVRMGGPCTVPATNLATVWKAADDEWVANMSEAEFGQLMLALDPWARLLVGFPFYTPETHAGWLNFMVVPDKPVQEMTDDDLATVAKTSQPGWNFISGDAVDYVWSLREVLSILSEHNV